MTEAHVREILLDGTLSGFKRGKRVWGVYKEVLEKWISTRGNARDIPRKEVRISKSFRKTTWDGKQFDEFSCPFCGFKQVWFEDAFIVDGKDRQGTAWVGRGDLVTIPMNCEGGCKFDFCIGFHKGDLSFFAREGHVSKEVGHAPIRLQMPPMRPRC
jgi:hypothetical protein